MIIYATSNQLVNVGNHPIKPCDEISNTTPLQSNWNFKIKEPLELIRSSTNSIKREGQNLTVGLNWNSEIQISKAVGQRKARWRKGAAGYGMYVREERKEKKNPHFERKEDRDRGERKWWKGDRRKGRRVVVKIINKY